MTRVANNDEICIMPELWAGWKESIVEGVNVLDM